MKTLSVGFWPFGGHSSMFRQGLFEQGAADEANYPATIGSRNPVKARGFGAATGGPAVASRRARSVRNSGWRPPRAPQQARKRPSRPMRSVRRGDHESSRALSA